MSRIGELFAKSCVNGIYSHYNPAESPDPSTQLPVQPTKASYNFFRSSKFHFTELWANEKKKYIYIRSSDCDYESGVSPTPTPNPRIPGHFGGTSSLVGRRVEQK